MFDTYEEGFDQCGKRIIGEEEVLGEVSVWVQKEYVLKSNHHRDSTEDPGGEGT